MTYHIEVAPSGVRALRQFDPQGRRRIQAVVELLAGDPRPPGALAIRGQPAGTFRVRSGDYRVIYEIHDDRLVVLVIRVGHRRDVYKGLS